MISHPLLTPEPISAADILADAAERYDRRELSGEQLATIAAALVRANCDDQPPKGQPMNRRDDAQELPRQDNAYPPGCRVRDVDRHSRRGPRLERFHVQGVREEPPEEDEEPERWDGMS